MQTPILGIKICNTITSRSFRNEKVGITKKNHSYHLIKIFSQPGSIQLIIKLFTGAENRVPEIWKKNLITTNKSYVLLAHSNSSTHRMIDNGSVIISSKARLLLIFSKCNSKYALPKDWIEMMSSATYQANIGM